MAHVCPVWPWAGLPSPVLPPGAGSFPAASSCLSLAEEGRRGMRQHPGPQSALRAKATANMPSCSQPSLLSGQWGPDSGHFGGVASRVRQPLARWM